MPGSLTKMKKKKKGATVYTTTDVGVYFGRQMRYVTTQSITKTKGYRENEEMEPEITKNQMDAETVGRMLSEDGKVAPYTPEIKDAIKAEIAEKAANLTTSPVTPEPEVWPTEEGLKAGEAVANGSDDKAAAENPDKQKPPAQVVSVQEVIKIPVEPGLLISGDPETTPVTGQAAKPQPQQLRDVRFAPGQGQWRKPKK